jgi:hypothetical protein
LTTQLLCLFFFARSLFNLLLFQAPCLLLGFVSLPPLLVSKTFLFLFRCELLFLFELLAFFNCPHELLLGTSDRPASLAMLQLSGFLLSLQARSVCSSKSLSLSPLSPSRFATLLFFSFLVDLLNGVALAVSLFTPGVSVA